MHEKLIGPRELAQFLNVKRSWVYAQTKKTGAGSIPRVKVRKYLRFSLQEVLNWLKEQDKNA